MPLGGVAIIGLVGAAASSILLWNRNATSFGVVTADNFSIFVNLVIIAVGILTVIISSQTVDRDRIPSGEYYATLLFAVITMAVARHRRLVIQVLVRKPRLLARP